MQTGEPSRTAMGVAIYRAEHQLEDGGRIFTDPLAVRIVDGMVDSLNIHEDPAIRRRMRLIIAARARYADDALAAAVAAGTTQAVVLGAGLDTLAYRNPHAGLRVYEIDHPATQEWKRNRLRETAIDIPGSVTYVPVDFERQTLEQAMAATEFDPSQPAFVIWLGVVVYLTGDAIRATLRYLAGLAPGTEVVLDYAQPVRAVTPEEQAMAEVRDARLAALGERWLSLFTPEEMAGELRAAGFEVAEDLDPAAAIGRYLGADLPAERLGPHIVRAVVPS
ncbi:MULTISPECIES: SAM-dependent methyltransferase [unclassified Nocardia]|uniref:class I SAM-dependent methyltransferase n=1 Tax=unclassified Nocardia TaxID=2637762 RepID=UPI001CE43782|nr:MULTISPECIES: SAM-dependent methyltransferase [unclassified Nocardia]